MSDTPPPTQINPSDILNLIAAAKVGLSSLTDEACEHVSASITRCRKAVAALQAQQQPQAAAEPVAAPPGPQATS